MRCSGCRIIPALLFIVTSNATAQGGPPQPPPEQLRRANALFTQGDWAGALAAYSGLAKDYPQHALARFRAGVAQLELGRPAEAEANLREGERLGIAAGQAGYRLGQVYAELHRPDDALRELQRSIAAGFGVLASSVQSDRHLTSLAGHQKWPAIVDAFDAVIQPCRHDARFREFDFWLGDWDVRPTGTNGGPPARNTVTLENNDCTIVEHWVAPGGSRGQSFNLFDRSVGKWRQTWVDNIAGQHDYRGELVNGNMAFIGDTPAPNGALGRLPTKLTFFRLGNDSVRQFSEGSTDGGKTWQTNYDLMYVRRAADSAALTSADRASIRAADSMFVAGWLKNDSAGVLNLFGRNAVLVPPGNAPVTGRAAIRDYWWPSGPPIRIVSFDHTIEEIGGGGGDLALVRARATLTWESAGGRQSSRSREIQLFQKDGAGQWRIIRHMWQPIP